MNKLVLPLLMYKEKGKKEDRKEQLVVPSWNHLYTIVRNRPILDKWAIAHKEKLAACAKEWAEENQWEVSKNQKVFVRAFIYWNDAREKDCHNLDKLILDSFEDIIFENDSYALLQYMDFDIDVANPRIEIEFELGEVFNRKEVAKIKKKEIKDKEKLTEKK